MVAIVRVSRTLLVLAAGLHAQAFAQQCCVAEVSTYCTAGTTVHGCVPSIAGVGVPSSVAASGFEIVVSQVEGQRSGLIYYGFAQIAVPWSPASSSYRCVSFPLQRTDIGGSGGVAGQCNGELRIDFNAWLQANPGGLGNPFVAGQLFFAQGWFRDPGAPKQTNLSNGLRFVLGPNCWAGPVGMVPISAGTFMMGSDAPSGHPYFNEQDSQPVHQVTISRCFWMGTTEVTQAQYSALMGTNPSFFSGASNPVERVSWFDAQAYCAALTAQQMALGNVPQGYQYRLPTTAEWEYACRAGTTTEFNLGLGLDCNQAKIGYSYHTDSWCSAQNSVPVRSYLPNQWGLYDMHGNVAEWCLDSIAAYPAGSVTDPFATGGPDRVFRGGSLASNSSDCRSGDPDGGAPTVTTIALGFRVVLAPILVP